MAAAATRAMLAAAVACAMGRTARAESPAAQLGAAYRAYDAGDLDGAAAALASLDDANLHNRDYARWLRGQVALLRGDADGARAQLSKLSGTRFATDAAWRLADADWLAGDRKKAAAAYAKLAADKDAGAHGDVGTARYRIAITKKGAAEQAALHAFRVEFPRHPLEPAAEDALRAIGGDGALALSPDEHVARAQHLTEVHLWDEAIAELMLVPDDATDEQKLQRDYWLGETLFKMRRRYADAGAILLRVSPKMGKDAAEAMFHGARALSRADHDDDAIVWYRKVVATYPGTPWAQEASFLIGWLDFNRGKYADAIQPLEESLRRYPSSKFSADALWFLGMSHYLSGDYAKAREKLEELSKKKAALEGGKGAYWVARAKQKLGDNAGAQADLRAIVGRYPFSWYSLLARARLAEAGVHVGPFGDATPPARGPAVATALDHAAEKDDLIARVDELLEAGLDVEAGDELERGEAAYVKRHPRADAWAVVFDRYKRARDFARAYDVAELHGEGALDGPPDGASRVWWENAYPRAYRELVEQYQATGTNPDDYLYSIMRQESGYNPHDLSYADAQGLLQMIPPTTERVAAVLGLEYAPGRLYEPEFNVRTGSWYIGHLLAKFKGQIPIGAGSFNSGPRPVMKWCDQNGDREIDEFVELVPYQQTREYMKRVTQNYARYVFLYGGTVYDQPLAVDKAYVRDDLTY
jgi:soluble lytic murein transglycosylase